MELRADSYSQPGDYQKAILPPLSPVPLQPWVGFCTHLGVVLPGAAPVSPGVTSSTQPRRTRKVGLGDFPRDRFCCHPVFIASWSHWAGLKADLHLTARLAVSPPLEAVQTPTDHTWCTARQEKGKRKVYLPPRSFWNTRTGCIGADAEKVLNHH